MDDNPIIPYQRHWFVRLIQHHALYLRELNNVANDNYTWEDYRQ